MKTMLRKDLSPYTIRLILSFWQSGDVVAFPTETVYGLGAPISQKKGIEKIYQVKGRPKDNPLIAHTSCLSKIEPWIEHSYFLDRCIESLAPFFPGPLTIIFPLAKKCREDFLPKKTIAFRIPSHPWALRILRHTNLPILAPSANLSGKPSPTRALDVLADLDGKIPLLIDGGACSVGIESTILSLTGEKPKILRPGEITRTMLSHALGQEIFKEEPVEEICPGTKYPHYAPKAEVFLIENKENIPNFSQEKTLFLSYQKPLDSSFVAFSKKNLYLLLRQADRLGKKTVCIYLDESVLGQEDIMNRIEKAAKHGQ